MSTKALLDRIMPRISSGWSRSTGNRSVLKIVEQGLDAIMESTISKRIWVGPENFGFPPFLLTTQGIRDYDLIAANLGCGNPTQTIGGVVYPVLIDNVRRVFISNCDDFELYLPLVGEPFFLYGADDYIYEGRRLNNRFRQVAVESYPAYETTPAHVRFSFDPQTTTNKYYVEFTWRAPRLLSESIQMPIPIDFELALEDYTIGRIQEIENGQGSQLLQKFESYWIPKYEGRLRQIATSMPTKTILRRY